MEKGDSCISYVLIAKGLVSRFLELGKRGSRLEETSPQPTFFKTKELKQGFITTA